MIVLLLSNTSAHWTLMNVITFFSTMAIENGRCQGMKVGNVEVTDIAGVAVATITVVRRMEGG